MQLITVASQPTRTNSDNKSRETESNGRVSSSPNFFVLVFLELGLNFFSLFLCLVAEKE
jgi:hypothetical protein